MSIAEKSATISANNVIIAENEQKVYNAGYEKGKTEGGGDNYYNVFWNDVLQNGERTNCSYLFMGTAWTAETFKPPYKISPTNADNMFYNASNLTVDLRDYDIDFTRIYSMQYAFRYSGVTALGVIDVSAGTSTSVTAMVANCSNLHTIDLLILRADGKQATNNNLVQNCNKLSNILIEGVIGKDISFQWCPLTKESIKGKEITLEEYSALSDTVKENNIYIEGDKYYYGGIIAALSATASGTATFKKTAINEAFGIDIDDETTWTTEFIELRNSKSNWTFSYV